MAILTFLPVKPVPHNRSAPKRDVTCDLCQMTHYNIKHENRAMSTDKLWTVDHCTEESICINHVTVNIVTIYPLIILMKVEMKIVKKLSQMNIVNCQITIKLTINHNG